MVYLNSDNDRPSELSAAQFRPNRSYSIRTQVWPPATRRAAWDGMWANMTSRSGRERLILSSPPIGPADTTFTLRIEATGGRWEREACAGHRDRLRQKESILTSIRGHGPG